jgi:hypothetical protein
MKKITASYGGFGFKPDREQCTKPEFKDGLCSEHYHRRLLKLTPWGERPTYRDVTEEEFLRGKTMLLKSSNQHVQYSYRKGQMVVWSNKTGKWSPSAMEADYTLYCVKRL